MANFSNLEHAINDCKTTVIRIINDTNLNTAAEILEVKEHILEKFINGQYAHITAKHLILIALNSTRSIHPEHFHNKDSEDQPDELQEWHDFDPDC